MEQINLELLKIAEQAEIDLKDKFLEIDKVCEKNSYKVLDAFVSNGVSTSIFQETMGYGYFDYERDKMEKVFADIYGAEDAIVRPQIISATNAIYVGLSALLKHGDTMLCITGELYDTIKSLVGLFGDSTQSLIACGVKYEEIDLVNKKDFDYKKIEKRLMRGGVKLVEIQRSRGYAHREGLSIDKVEKVCKLIKSIDPNIIIFVDNCYCDMVEEIEPTQVGADVLIGSLMHNLGAGIATSGGYFIGKQKYLAEIAERLTSPCIGKNAGANYNQNCKFLKGLYMAPQTVANALKTALFSAYMFSKVGYKDISPSLDYHRSDTVQTIDLHSRQQMIDFCVGVQKFSPIDGIYSPEPCEVPGYPHEEIMASGAFTSGSTIELSCDGPLVEPYTVFIQGSMTFAYGKIAILGGINEILKNK